MPTSSVPKYPTTSQEPYAHNPYYSAPPPPECAYFGENARLIQNNPQQVQHRPQAPAYSKSTDKRRNAKSAAKITCGISCLVVPLLMLIAAFTMSTVSLAKLGAMSSLLSKNFMSCVDCDTSGRVVPGALSGIVGLSRARDSLYKGFGVSLVPSTSTRRAPSYFPTADQEVLGTAIMPFDESRFGYAVVSPRQTIQVIIFAYDGFGYYNILESTQLPCKNIQLLKGVALRPGLNEQRNFGFIVKCDTSNYYFTQVFADTSKRSQYSAITLTAPQSDPQVLDLIAMDDQSVGFVFTNTVSSSVIFGVCGSDGDWFKGCTTANAVSQRLACSKPATAFRAPDVVEDSRTWLSMGVVCDNQAKTFVFRPTTMTGVEELNSFNVPSGSQTSRFYNFETPAFNTSMLHTVVRPGGVLKARLVTSLDTFNSGVSPAEIIIDTIDGSATQPSRFDYQFLETERASFFVYMKNGQRVIKVISFNDFKPNYAGTTSGIVIKKQTLDTTAFASLSGVYVLASNNKGVFMFGSAADPQTQSTMVTSGLYQIFGAPSLFGIGQKLKTWRTSSPYTTYFGGVIKAPGAFTEGQRFKMRSTGEVLPVDAASEPGVPEYFIGVAISKDELLLQLSFEEL